MACVTALTVSAAKIGDPAAPLTIKEWVKGQAVNVKDGKSLYVVEFWATWCGPCRTSIPHLTKLQKQFKDKGVVFIGISDETADKVKPFVEQMADKMDYVVAIDNERKTSDGYMTAYGQGGIPCAFVVGKDGKVLWVGHPMDNLDKTIEDVLAGSFDLQAAIKKDEARVKKDDYLKLSVAGDAKAKKLGNELLADAGNNVGELCDFAFSIAANASIKNRDFALALDALSKAEKAAGGKSAQVIGTRAVVLFESGKKEEGLAAAKQAVELSQDDKERARYQNFVKVMEARLKQAGNQK